MEQIDTHFALVYGCWRLLFDQEPRKARLEYTGSGKNVFQLHLLQQTRQKVNESVVIVSYSGCCLSLTYSRVRVGVVNIPSTDLWSRTKSSPPR